MPKVCEFHGILIYMYRDEHNPPHFHALYGDDEISVRIDTVEIIAGRLPRRAERNVLRWAAARQSELSEDWRLSHTDEPLRRIDPLD